MIQRSGKYRYTVDYCDQTGCKLTFWGREAPGRGAWEVLGSTEFTLEMARKAMIYEKERGSERATQKPLADKWNYKSWAEDMFFARAMTRGHRYCAEVFGGLVALPTDLQEAASPEAQKDGATHVRDLWGDPAPARTALMVEAPVTPQDAPEAVVVPERPRPQPRPAVAPGTVQDDWEDRAHPLSADLAAGGAVLTRPTGLAARLLRPGHDDSRSDGRAIAVGRQARGRRGGFSDRARGARPPGGAADRAGGCGSRMTTSDVLQAALDLGYVYVCLGADRLVLSHPALIRPRSGATLAEFRRQRGDCARCGARPPARVCVRRIWRETACIRRGTGSGGANMAGTADMTAAEFRQRYGRQAKGRRPSSVSGRRQMPDDWRRTTALIRLEVDGVAVTPHAFLAAHARYCPCLEEEGPCPPKR